MREESHRTRRFFAATRTVAEQPLCEQQHRGKGDLFGCRTANERFASLITVMVEVLVPQDTEDVVQRAACIMRVAVEGRRAFELSMSEVLSFGDVLIFLWSC